MSRIDHAYLTSLSFSLALGGTVALYGLTTPPPEVTGLEAMPDRFVEVLLEVEPVEEPEPEPPQVVIPTSKARKESKSTGCGRGRPRPDPRVKVERGWLLDRSVRVYPEELLVREVLRRPEEPRVIPSWPTGSAIILGIEALSMPADAEAAEPVPVQAPPTRLARISKALGKAAVRPA